MGYRCKRYTWAQALQPLKGKQTFVTSDGFPVLFGVVTLGSRPGPLWVVDGERATCKCRSFNI